METPATDNKRPDYDTLLMQIADYVVDYVIDDPKTLDMARHCLIDSLGCGLLALRYPECHKHLGPIVPNTLVPIGARVPGTQFELDPIKAAFDIGCMVRWLDFNDTWHGSEPSHPSDNLGAILAVADFVSRQQIAGGYEPLSVRDVLVAMIKAYEIHGLLALENNFQEAGFDHVLLVKLASAAVVTHLLGGGQEEIVEAMSQAIVDGQSLRTYRQSPNTGSRKSWAAADATSRAVRLAFITMTGEMGYPTSLSANEWGFSDALFAGKALSLSRPLDCYVIENTSFKLTSPGEYHGQTAIECAVILHPEIAARVDDVERVDVTTHAAAVRAISKSGELDNPADRDHCLEYMVATGLVFGQVHADHYLDSIATDPRIAKLQEKMMVIEDSEFTAGYQNLEHRNASNAVQVFFKDGTSTDKVIVENSLGHPDRRDEGVVALVDKFERNVFSRFPKGHGQQILELCLDREELEETPVNELIDLLLI